MSTVTGTVKVCKQSKFGWGLLLEEDETKWYNSKFEIKANTGDNVTFDDGGKNYVNKLKVNTGGVVAKAGSVTTSAAPAKTHYLPVPLDNSRAIIRQNALTNARELIATLHMQANIQNKSSHPKEEDDILADRIIVMARIFENYTSGDADMAVALKALENMEAK